MPRIVRFTKAPHSVHAGGALLRVACPLLAGALPADPVEVASRCDATRTDASKHSITSAISKEQVRSMSVTPEHLARAVEMAREYGATQVILFGSALEAPEQARDLDLACDIPGLDLFAYAGQLEKELQLPVDVIPLQPSNAFVEAVKQRGKVIYEAGDAARGSETGNGLSPANG